jgi:hypothetical protein
MAIINCPTCRGKLKFPDDSPPRRVKCPACGTQFVAGPKGPIDETGEKPASKSSPAAAKNEEVAEDFDVVDDDKPLRSKSRDGMRQREEDDRIRKKRRDEDDEDDRDRNKRRDEDDEDDRDRVRKKRRDEDDEDDRDRKKRRDDDDEESPAIRRKARRDDDDDDDRDSRSRRKSRRDDDDDDDRGPRSKKKLRRDDGGRIKSSQWEWARKGISFVNFGYYCQLGSFAAVLLYILIEWMGGHETVILALACLPGLIGFILAGIGIGFIVAGPRRGNLLGYSIALAAVAGVHLILMFIASFGDAKGVGALGRSSVNWLIMPSAFLECAVMVAFRHGEALIICTAIFEVARYVLYMLYLKELGKICKAREATNRTTMLLVALPSALAGSLLVALLGIELMKEAMPSRTFAQIFVLLYAIAKLGAYSFIYLLTMKTANEISDAAYKMY